MKTSIVGLALILFTAVLAQDQYVEELRAARSHLEKILINDHVKQQHLNVISNYVVLLALEELSWYEMHVPDKEKRRVLFNGQSHMRHYRNNQVVTKVVLPTVLSEISAAWGLSKNGLPI